ncbi:MAG: Unknown protein [uncultured Sulfurovum sp.]|uniref:DUF4178 domain-containing protein n=1 Tax=uncultured Sulfurovum sp. TaxID=269237 RepID=A0A6S6SH07_9BACT|nr:MAG: Unknown protein [uncultured Sulfurovum sp.]
MPPTINNDANTISYNCPQCGDKLNILFKYSKLIKCQSCNSSIFLEDESVKVIGERSVLSTEPSLIHLHKMFKLNDKTFMPLGKIRYDYGRGFWEEWFLKDDNNKEFWLSIDEGNFVLEEKIKLVLPFKNFQQFKLGKKYNNYLVTEKGFGICVGFEGELPKEIKMNAKHQYVHLSAGYNKLLSIEFNEEGIEVFQGEWLNPLDIEVLY